MCLLLDVGWLRDTWKLQGCYWSLNWMFIDTVDSIEIGIIALLHMHINQTHMSKCFRVIKQKRCMTFEANTNRIGYLSFKECTFQPSYNICKQSLIWKLTCFKMNYISSTSKGCSMQGSCYIKLWIFTRLIVD